MEGGAHLVSLVCGLYDGAPLSRRQRGGVAGGASVVECIVGNIWVRNLADK